MDVSCLSEVTFFLRQQAEIASQKSLATATVDLAGIGPATYCLPDSRAPAAP